MPHADRQAKRAYARAWYAKNREKILARAKYLRNHDPHAPERRAKKAAYVRANREKFASYKRLKRHRPSPGVCEICGKEGKRVRDHCHTTNLLRGAICSFCNFMLGFAKDTPSILAEGIRYLERWHPERNL